ncbi:MAG: hypothetical protein HUU37_00040 [Bdellovibrionales bacterium]|nr:hypothetical protein [Bdellovibrionales bacterium]
MRGFTVLLIMLLANLAAADENTQANKLEDSFAVRNIGAAEIKLSGKVLSLKSGDFLYFVRPPYRFRVKAVDADLDEVVVDTPQEHDLKPGVALLRHPTPQIRKFLKTQERAEEALLN